LSAISSIGTATLESIFSIGFPFLVAEVPRHGKTKKADVAEHPRVFDHVGLLFNEPPGRAGLLFI
jgi:hypothetical protein